MNTPALALPSVGRSLLRAIDLPAREALETARRPLSYTLTPALIGLSLIALASLISAALDPGRTGTASLVPRADVLRAVIEALAVVVPGAIGFAVYLQLRIPARAMLAATAIGLLVGGVVAISLVPLMAFLAIVARAQPTALVTPGFLVPAIALAAVAAIPVRVIRALDRSDRATWLARAFSVLVFAAFAIRVAPYVRELFTR